MKYKAISGIVINVSENEYIPTIVLAIYTPYEDALKHTSAIKK